MAAATSRLGRHSMDGSRSPTAKAASCGGGGSSGSWALRQQHAIAEAGGSADPAPDAVGSSSGSGEAFLPTQRDPSGKSLCVVRSYYVYCPNET